MAKKQDNNIIFFIIIALLIILIFKGGGFQTIINKYQIVDETKILETEIGDCSLKLSKYLVNPGELVRGTIKDGFFANCDVYIRANNLAWISAGTYQTDDKGEFSYEDNAPQVPGAYEIIAICTDADGSCKTNSEILTIIGVVPDVFDCNAFCIAKDYEDGRSVDDCSYCNLINEVCEVSGTPISINLEHCCCRTEDFEIGCNDNDFTQTSFDTSIMFPGYCIDDLGQHDDACEPDGLLREWSCPEGGDTADTCSYTLLNCKSYLGDDAICNNGQCVIKECDVNIECSYIYGYGYVCRDNMCLEVTSGNCNSIVQDEGYEVGLWISGGDYIDCNAQCDSYCPTGCDTASTGGTWGDCCGYSCN